MTKNNKKTIKKDKKRLLIVVIVIVSISILFVATKDLRMEKKALVYLHDKYGFSYSDMKVVKITNYSEGVLSSGIIYRGAIVKYKKNMIYVFYHNNELVDDYVEIDKYTDEVIEHLNKLLKKHIKDYKVTLDPKLIVDDMEFDNSVYADGYIIYVYLNNEEVLEKLINELNEYVKNNYYTDLSMYVIGTKKTYKDIISADYSALLEKRGGQTYPTDLLKEAGYDATRITVSTTGYKKDIFLNKGNINDEEYINANAFNDVIYWYSLETNDFSKEFGDTTNFYVFGINKK